MKHLLLVLTVICAPAFAQSGLTQREVLGFEGQYMSDILENNKVLRLLVSNMGGSNYESFVKATGTQSPAEIYDGRFLLVSGCVPHNCGGNDSFFVIDSWNTGALLVLRQRQGVNQKWRNDVWRSSVTGWGGPQLTAKINSH